MIGPGRGGCQGFRPQLGRARLIRSQTQKDVIAIGYAASSKDGHRLAHDPLISVVQRPAEFGDPGDGQLVQRGLRYGFQ